MKISSLFLCLFLCTTLFAQKDFEGVVEYDITYEDLSDEIKAYASVLPKNMKMEVKNKISRISQANPMTGGENIIITDDETGKSMTLMDNMGEKIAIISEEKKEDEKEPEISYIDESKEIAGYKCFKAIVGDEDAEVEIFYTEELPNMGTKAAKGLKGFPMQIKIETEKFTMIQTVSSVESIKIKDLSMDIPKDYNPMTMEQFQNRMNGMK